MTDNYSINQGQNLKFKLVKEDTSVLSDYIKTHVLSLDSIQAFCILDRIQGLIIQKRIRTLLVFYQDESNYKSDNLIISEKLDLFYKNKTEILDLISLDIEHEFTLTLVETLTARGFDIIEKE